ncbi:hypothetical protein GDO78_016552 [Eleutherodactylus coqui]|uniref:Uncharacterized protein n=1 Tax=Eleutherodactylus coqui TaxID=57060 RepID=A0A8J6EBG2_ELECQ|nr:hypothetical protein GDO78_016552 [Eleutherodactylus coqui]
MLKLSNTGRKARAEPDTGRPQLCTKVAEEFVPLPSWHRLVCTSPQTNRGPGGPDEPRMTCANGNYMVIAYGVRSWRPLCIFLLRRVTNN